MAFPAPHRRQRGQACICALFMVVLAAGCGDPEQAGETTIIDDLAMLPPSVTRSSAGTRKALGLGPTVLFLNFGGATIKKSLLVEDSSKDTAAAAGGTIPPFPGTAADQSGVVEKVSKLFSAYNVLVVTSRPASGDYHMAVIGGEVADLDAQVTAPPAGSYVAGLAPLDCGNKMARNIAFVFAQTILTTPNSLTPFTEKVASSTAHELGHTLGLPHSDDGCDVMSYGTCWLNKTFLDKTMGMQDPAGSGFADPRCGLSSMNSHQMLLATLGIAGATPADAEAPKVTVTWPTSGSEIGAGITVQATIQDDVGVTSASALVDGAVMASASAAPFAFPLSGLSDGAHEIAVQAVDAAGNQGSASVTVTVVTSQPQPDPPPAQPPPGPPPVDTKPPLVTITSPQNGATVGAAITVQAAITDDVGVSSAKLLVDGAIGPSDASPPYSFPLSGLSDGEHTIVVEARDAAGNKGSASVTVTAGSKPSGNPGGSGGCNGVLAELMEDNCSVARSFGAVNLPVVLTLLLLWVTIARRRPPHARHRGSDRGRSR